jgi:transmembrane sensor
MSVQKEIDRLIAQRAAEWFEIYRTGDVEKYAAAMAWLVESPRHMAEFLEIARRYSATRQLLQGDPFDIETLLKKPRPGARALRAGSSRTRTAPGATAERVATAPESQPRMTRSVRWRWVAGLAAAGLAVAVTFAVWKGVESVSPRQQYVTQVGEQRNVPLSDGSVVELNTDSRIDVRMDQQERDIVLHGEAIFKVAHETARPFLVHTEHATVRAVGTQFNVYGRPDGSTTIAVLEGKVEVSAGAEGRGHPGTARSGPEPNEMVAAQQLAAGEVARVDRSGDIRRDEKTDVRSVVAWRRRRLVFDRTPLEEIVPEFNRYNRNLRLRLVDVPAGAYHYTGNFDADDPKSWALLLSEERGLEVEEREGEILIHGRLPSR